MHLITQRRVADPADGQIGAALRLGRYISVATILAGTAVIALLGAHDATYWPLMLMPLWVASEKQVEAWLAVRIADGSPWLNATSLVLRRLSALVIMVLLHAVGVGAVPACLLGLSASSLIAWLAMPLIIRDIEINRSASVGDLLRGGRNFWIHNLSTQAVNFDVFLVGLVTTPQIAGFYATASRLTTPLRMVPHSFATVLFPAAARSKKGDNRTLARTVGLLIALTTAMYLTLAIALPPAVPILLGQEFAPAADVVRIVCVGLIFAAATSQFRALMQGWGYLRAVSIISVTSTAISLAAVMASAAHYGAVGAAIALSVSYVAQLILQLISLLLLHWRRNEE